MESTTIFLAQLWGPAMLAVGLGILMNKGHYSRIYREVEKEPFALLAFGVGGIIAGIAHILAHNVWSTLPEMIVSLFGWALLLKAVVFVIKPKIADTMAEWYVHNKMLPVASTAAIILGVYLSWVGYIA